MEQGARLVHDGTNGRRDGIADLVDEVDVFVDFLHDVVDFLNVTGTNANAQTQGMEALLTSRSSSP